MFFSNESHIKEINRLKRQVADLQIKMRRMEKNFEFEIGVKKAHILKLKNGEALSDDFVINNRSYMDLSPEAAYEIYNDFDQDFILLDVSAKSFTPPQELPEALKIPLDDLANNLHRLPGKGKSYLVISEDGVRSIKACRFLNINGYFNLSNISGGYLYWPAFRSISSIVKDDQVA